MDKRPILAVAPYIIGMSTIIILNLLVLRFPFAHISEFSLDGVEVSRLELYLIGGYETMYSKYFIVNSNGYMDPWIATPIYLAMVTLTLSTLIYILESVNVLIKLEIDEKWWKSNVAAFILSAISFVEIVYYIEYVLPRFIGQVIRSDIYLEYTGRLYEMNYSIGSYIMAISISVQIMLSTFHILGGFKNSFLSI